jgi:phenylacetate-CoA ligase
MRTWHGLAEQDEAFVAEYMAISDAFQRGEASEAFWRGWYDRRLPVVLRHVKQRSPFYRRLYEGIDVDRIDLATLATLPFTTKDDLQRAQFDILAGDLREAQFYYATTGTTGPSTPCPRDKKDLFTNNVQIAFGLRRLLDKHFAGRRKPLVAVLAPNELHSICGTFSSVCSELGVCKLDPYPASLVIGFEKCVRVLKELEVDVVLGTPGLALILAQIAEMYGLDCKRDFGIELLLSTGEICTPAMERNIRGIWGCQVYNFIYASQEGMAMAMASPDNTYYPTLPNYVFEVVDPDGDASFGSTGTGELCITMLIDGIKPLIRYRTGDLVHLFDSDRTGPERRVLQVLGRKKDFIALAGRRFTAYQIEQAVMDGVTSCVGYQVVIGSRDRADHLTVKLQLMHGCDVDRDELRERLVGKLRRELGVDATILFVLQLDDIVNTGGWISWKAARVVDDRGSDERTRDANALEKGHARDLARSSVKLIL